MPPAKPSLQDQIDALTAMNEALTARIEAGEKMRNETHKMVSDMHRALMEPQLGQGDKSMVERIAKVVVDIESGQRTTDNLIAIAKRLVAVTAFLAAIAAFLKFGQVPRE
jgi:hypothetical protein